MNAFKIAAVAVAMTLGASAVQAEEMRLDEAQLDVVVNAGFSGFSGFPGFSQFSFQRSGSSNGKTSGRVPQGVSSTSLQGSIPNLQQVFAAQLSTLPLPFFGSR